MGIRSANEECLKRIRTSTAVLVDIRLAREVVPGLDGQTVYHAGPPVTWDRMCGPMRGAIIGACMFEGWAESPEEAISLAESGALHFDSCHHHRAIGPMSGIITPSMQVHVVGKVLRHGAHDESVMRRLAWMNHDLAPLLKNAIHRAEGIDIKNIIAQALQMGDELHNRNKASNALLLAALAPHLVAVGAAAEVERALTFIDGAGHFILNSVMAGCKGMLDAGHGVEGATIVTAIARNGVETGIRVAGTGDRWFTAPAPKIEGVYFPGYSADDANPDLGDSAITETMGLGSLAMAGAPAVVQYIGGTPQFAVETTRRMSEITVTEHDTFQIPNLNFRGTPFGIDIRKVVETGIVPVINTGIAHKKPGIGQIGAGLTEAPMACFTGALTAFAEIQGVSV
jgi:hypothetical protein